MSDTPDSVSIDNLFGPSATASGTERAEAIAEEETGEPEEEQVAAPEDAPPEDDAAPPEEAPGEVPPVEPQTPPVEPQKAEAPPPYVQEMQRQFAHQSQATNQVMQQMQQQFGMLAQESQATTAALLGIINKAEQRRVQAEMEATRPVYPAEPTPENINNYVESLTQWNMRQQTSELQKSMGGYIGNIQQKLQALETDVKTRQQAMERTERETYVNNVISSLQTTKGYEFLRDNGNQQDFLDKWYAMNARDPKGFVDPMVVANVMRGRMPSQPAAVRDAKKQLANKNRARQNAQGVPPVVRAGQRQSGGKSAEEITKEVIKQFGRSDVSREIDVV